MWKVPVSNLGHPETCSGLPQSLKANAGKQVKSSQDNCLLPLFNALFSLKLDDVRSKLRTPLLNK
jgi:hypothetical protein